MGTGHIISFLEYIKKIDIIIQTILKVPSTYNMVIIAIHSIRAMGGGGVHLQPAMLWHSCSIINNNSIDMLIERTKYYQCVKFYGPATLKSNYPLPDPSVLANTFIEATAYRSASN